MGQTQRSQQSLAACWTAVESKWETAPLKRQIPHTSGHRGLCQIPTQGSMRSVPKKQCSLCPRQCQRKRWPAPSHHPRQDLPHPKKSKPSSGSIPYPIPGPQQDRSSAKSLQGGFWSSLLLTLLPLRTWGRSRPSVPQFPHLYNSSNAAVLCFVGLYFKDHGPTGG